MCVIDFSLQGGILNYKLICQFLIWEKIKKKNSCTFIILVEHNNNNNNNNGKGTILIPRPKGLKDICPKSPIQ